MTAPEAELRSCDRCGALTPNVRRCRECKRLATVPRRRPRALSEAQCLALLEQRRAGTRGRKLAELFGVSYDTVRRIEMYYGVSVGGWHGRGAGEARDGSKPPDPPPEPWRAIASLGGRTAPQWALTQTGLMVRSRTRSRRR